MQLVSNILQFLSSAHARIEIWASDSDDPQAETFKDLIKSDLNEKIDIRTVQDDFKKIVLHLGIEAGRPITRGEVDPNYPFPGHFCPPGYHILPESLKKVMDELYVEGMTIVNRY